MRDPLEYNTSHMVTAGKIYLGHTWWYFRDHDMSILAPPKCGSSSIKQFIWMNELEDRVQNITHEQVTGRVCAVVRSPYGRFISLWRSKCRDKERIRDTAVHGMTPRELMEHIKAGNKDVHWTAQADMIKGLDPELVPLPYLIDWWKREGFGDIGVFNRTEGHVDLDSDMFDWINEYYAEDHALYKKALDLF